MPRFVRNRRRAPKAESEEIMRLIEKLTPREVKLVAEKTEHVKLIAGVKNWMNEKAA